MLAPVSAPAATSTSTTAVERECVRAAAVLGLGVAGAAVLLWAASFPGWPLAAGVMISVLVVAVLLVVAGGHPPPGPARWLRPVAVVVALVIGIGGGLIIGHTGHFALSMRFSRSAPAFDATAAAAGPVPTQVADHWLPYPGECPAQIGSYKIGECRAFSAGFVYVQERRAFRDEAGFAYVPNAMASAGDTGSLAGKRLTHLSGPWYAWS